MNVQHSHRYEPAPPPNDTEVIRGSINVIDMIAPEWRDLCADGTHDELLYRPEWIAAYLRAFEPQAKAMLATVRRCGILRAVLPLVQDKLTVLGADAIRGRGPANKHFNRFDLIHGDGDGEWAIASAWRTLVNLPGWDVIDVEDVPDGGTFQGPLDFALYELWCGDAPVAFELGYVLKGRYFVLKVAYDVEFKPVGPRHLIIGEVLRALQARQMTELDMPGHTDSSKARWTDLYRQHDQCHTFRRGPAGRAFQAWTDRFKPASRRVHRKLRGPDGTNWGAEFGTIGLIGQEAVRWC